MEVWFQQIQYMHQLLNFGTLIKYSPIVTLSVGNFLSLKGEREEFTDLQIKHHDQGKPLNSILLYTSRPELELPV